MTFRDLGLEPELLKSIERLGFETPTPIQIQCFGPGIAGKNIVGISQTGTGKTLAFLLPVLNRIYKEKIDSATAIILAPTRELCVQISEELVRLTKDQSIRVATVYGGEGYNRQEKELAANPHFIVATPGRLIDFMKQKKIPVSTMKVLVLDEADRMFDMGFIRDIRYVMRSIPSNSQVMLFTATMSYYVMRLITDFMDDPQEIKIDTDQVEVEKIKQSLYHLSIDEKMPYLVNLIKHQSDIKAIVFTNSRHRVQDLVRVLCKYGVHATGISSLLDQKKRIELLKSFKLGKHTVLVATDVASRGLDIDDITHVFNYDLPQDAESYVHRIGRTARAGKDGIAISFCSETDYECLPRIEILLDHKIPLASIETEFFTFPEPSPVEVPSMFAIKPDRPHEKQRHGQKTQGKGRGDRQPQGRGDRSKSRNDRSKSHSGPAQFDDTSRGERGSRKDYSKGKRQDQKRSQTGQKQRQHSQGQNYNQRDRQNARQGQKQRHQERPQVATKQSIWQKIVGFFKRKESK